MKNLFKTLIVAGVVAALVCGCGASENAENADGEKAAVLSVEEFGENLTEYVNVSKYSAATVSEDGSNSTYSLNSDLHKEFAFNPAIYLDSNTKVTFPMTYEALKTEGWCANSSSQANITLKPGCSASAQCVYGGKEITVYTVNYTEENMVYTDGTVDRISFKLYSEEDNFEKKLETAPEFNFAGDIDNDSDINEVIRTLGDPSKITYSVVNENCSKITLLYQNIATYDYLKIEFNSDGTKILNLDYHIDIR